MFIEFHQPKPITININKIEYFAPVYNGKHTVISMHSDNDNDNGWLHVEESYEQVKELIEKCLKK